MPSLILTLAYSQKFHKLKREADSILNATSGSDDVATATTTNDTPNTPATSVGGRKKRAPATATPKKTLAGATKGRKRKAAALADDDDGEKELDIDGIVETPVTPSKKSRKAKAATKQGKVDGSENGAVRVASDEDLVQTGGAGAGAEDEV